MSITARNSGYYVVYVDGEERSQHTAEREAIEVAQEAANDGRDVWYEHQYTVDVTSNDGAHSSPESDHESENDSADETGELDDPANESKPSEGDVEDSGNTSDDAICEYELVDGTKLSDAVPAGERKLLKTADGEKSSLLVINYGDGSVIDEGYDQNVQVKNATIEVGGKKFVDAGYTAYARRGSRPRRYKLGKADIEKVQSIYPPYKGGEDRNMGADFAKAKFTRDSYRGWVRYMPGTGENDVIGVVSTGEARAIQKPTPANISMVRKLADGAAPCCKMIRHPETFELLDPHDSPATNTYGLTQLWDLNDLTRLAPNNFSTDCPVTEDTAHHPAMVGVSSQLWGTEYDKERAVGIALWMSCLAWNPGYRYNRGKGAHAYGRYQNRGFAWTIRSLASAAVLDHPLSPRCEEYLDQLLQGSLNWLDGDKNEHRPPKNPDKCIPYYPHLNRYDGKGVAFWMYWYQLHALAFCARLGFKKAETALHRYGRTAIEAALHPMWPLATLYTHRVLRDDGSAATSWDEVLQLTAASDGRVAKALEMEPDSQELQDLFGDGAGNIGGFVGGYQHSAYSYMQSLRYAIYELAHFGVQCEAGTAKEALAVMDAHDFSNYGESGKYHPE